MHQKLQKQQVPTLERFYVLKLKQYAFALIHSWRIIASYTLYLFKETQNNSALLCLMLNSISVYASSSIIFTPKFQNFLYTV